MRVTGGKYKGRNLRLPHADSIRPTTDIAREALFNILRHQFDIDGACILDLFCGSGIMTFEFLSRDAAKVDAVDLNGRALSTIKKVLDELGDNRVKLYRKRAEAFVKQTASQYDLIFMDPPYDYAGYRELISEIFKQKLLNPDGILVVEHAKQHDYADLPGFGETRSYGNSSFSFFRPAG